MPRTRHSDHREHVLGNMYEYRTQGRHVVQFYGYLKRYTHVLRAEEVLRLCVLKFSFDLTARKTNIWNITLPAMYTTFNRGINRDHVRVYNFGRAGMKIPKSIMLVYNAEYSTHAGSQMLGPRATCRLISIYNSPMQLGVRSANNVKRFITVEPASSYWGEVPGRRLRK